MDAATINALGSDTIYIQWFAWLDIEDDPVFAVTGVRDVYFAPGSTGDPDLDGKTFEAIHGDLIDISDVQHDESGSETVTARLSGLPFENNEMLDIVGQKLKWRKKQARLWFRLLVPVEFGEGGTPKKFNVLPMQRYYSGYLVNLVVDTMSDGQTITAVIENYQVMLSEGSGLTYLHQNEFDAGDNSASQTLAAANGMQKAGVSGSIKKRKK